MTRRHAIGAFAILATLALLWGLAGAAVQWWTTDDAFISFRYARNLVEGMGLVYNPGERVEGYTNFLWTVWAATGLRLGFPAESWANAWSLLSYLGTVVLLALHGRRLSRLAGAGWFPPVAALGAAIHPDWNVFATSGLETSPFTFLLVAGFYLVAWHPRDWRRTVAAGALLAAATLTRPDGILPAFVLGLLLLAPARRVWRAPLAYGLAFAAIWLPFLAWRLSYYGEFFPNTYYAKSAYLPWYSQGLHYLGLYLERYWLLLAGPVLWLVAARSGRGRAVDAGAAGGLVRQALLAAAVAVAYTFYVVRVGGDFMFARMLIPATPFWLVLVETGLLRALGGRPRTATAIAGALCAGMLLSPSPVTGTDWRHGVANERLYYDEEKVAGLDHVAEVLEPAFRGLPVRVAFFGDEARVMYKARIRVAIESSAGLTEPALARRDLDARGRVGHEKHATAEFLVRERRAHFTFSSVPEGLLRLDRYIPEVPVRFGRDVWGRVLHWDPELMDELRRRGVGVPDFERQLDAYVDRLDDLTDEQVRRVYERLKWFYFEPVGDAAREAAFLRRLGRLGDAGD